MLPLGSHQTPLYRGSRQNRLKRVVKLIVEYDGQIQGLLELRNAPPYGPTVGLCLGAKDHPRCVSLILRNPCIGGDVHEVVERLGAEQRVGVVERDVEGALLWQREHARCEP